MYTYMQNIMETQGVKESFQKMVWFGLVYWALWHINLYRFFNAKSIFM